MNNISLFNNVKHTKEGQTIPISAFLEGIRDGRWNNEIIDYRAGKKPKTSLPLVTVCGVFSERKITGLIEPSGFICIDIDNVDPNEVKEQLCTDKHTYAAWTSVSGNGVAAIFKINPKRHADSFEGLSEYLFSNYQIIVDPSGKDVSRSRFVSTDHEIFINEGAAKFLQYPKEKQLPVKKLPKTVYVQSDFDEIIATISQRGIDIVDSYLDWRNAAFALSDKFGEAGRHYFHTISNVSHKYSPEKCDRQYSACLNHKGSGITIASFYYLCKQAGISTISERTRTIGTAASHARKGRRSISDTIDLLSKVEGIPEQESAGIVQQVFDNNIDFTSEESLVEELEMYLRQNYNLRRNVLTRKIDNGGDPLETRHLNSIFVQAKKIFEKLSFELLDRVINSDFTKDYNPLKDFFEANKHKRPVGLIERLAKTIPSSQPFAYVHYFIRKWLVGIIHAVEEDDFSPLMLVLSGELQNTGKTEWFRRLLPKDIRTYYAESKLDAGKDDEILMTSKLIIMDDEMGGKSKRETARLKELTSKKWFSLREPYGRHNVDLRRLAVLCGTSNDNEILNDPTGNRRIIPIEVTGDIDKTAYNAIIKEDLFMEAYHLYKDKDVSPDMTREEIESLNAHTRGFEAVILEKELIQQYIEPGSQTFGCEFMTTSAIKVYLEGKTMQRLSLKRVGMELKSLNFERTKLNSSWGYWARKLA